MADEEAPRSGKAPLAVAAARLAALIAGVVLLVIDEQQGIAAALIVGALLAGAAPAVVQLLAAVRPLLLPVALAAMVAAAHLPLLPALAIGALVAVLVVPWITHDPARSRAIALGIGATVGKLVRAGLPYLLAVAAIGGVALAVVLIAGDQFDDLAVGGAVSLVLIDVSLVCWALAVGFRMQGYMRNWARVVLGGVVGLALLRFGLYLAFELPFDDELPPQTLFIVAAVLLAPLILLEALRDVDQAALPGGLKWLCGVAARATKEFKRAKVDTAYARGIGWSLAATLLLGLALLISWTAIGSDTVDVKGRESVGGAPSMRPGDMKPEELSETFAPVLTFDHKQQWLPQRVDKYVSGATLVPSSSRPGLPDRCQTGRSDPCYELHCDSADAPCALKQDLSDRKGRDRGGVAYVRVVKRGEQPRDGSPQAFEDKLWKGAGEQGDVSILVQYWLFYPYDEWRAGTIRQSHAGDWEAVTVGLSEDEPLFVGYSAHCGGNWDHWRDVRVGKGTPSATHPLVAVAVGSQANYARADEARSPDWSSCQGLPTEAVRALSFAYNLRDRTGADFELELTDRPIVDGTKPPMNFPGRWGEKDSYEFGLVEKREVHKQGGIRTPTRQPLWRTPMRQIFCGKASRPRRPSKVCAQ